MVGDTTPSFDRRLLVPMVLGAILNPVNSSIIAVALVPIGVAFGAPASRTAWLVSGLYLATAIGQPVVGRLVDTFGPRRLYLVGTALVGLAGVMGLLAPSLGVLVAARVVLGFGTCAGYPAAMSLIRSEAARTGRQSPAAVLTVLSVATQTVAVIGPTLGGLLIAVGGWRATYAVNIPLAVACLVLGGWTLPHTTPFEDCDDPGGVRPRTRMDLVGIGLFAATLVSLLLFLLDAQVTLLWLVALAAVGATAFAAWERRTPAPFIDLRVLAGNRPLLVTYVRALLAATVSYCFLYGFTQWLEAGRGLSATQAGLVLLPTFAVGIGVAALTGRRREIRGKLLVGAGAQVVGCLLILLLPAHAPVAWLLAVAIVLGLPQGLVNLAVQNTLYHQADPERIGASAGLQRTFMYGGAMLAAAAGGALFHHGVDLPALRRLALFMLACALLFLLVTVLDRSLAAVDARARAGVVGQ